MPELATTQYHDYVDGEGNVCLQCNGPIGAHFPTKKTETVAEEASRIVYGDREKTYDDPNRNFRKLAHMFQGVLDGKLKEGATITPNDVALMLICLKISRESFKPSRENRVDGIGYWLCLDRIVEADNAN